MTFVFQRVHSVSVSVETGEKKKETGEESQGRILHINNRTIDTNVSQLFPNPYRCISWWVTELWRKRWETLIPLNYLCQNILTIVLWIVNYPGNRKYVSEWNLSNQMGREKPLWLALHLLKTKESFSMYKVSCQDSLRE